MRYGIGSLRGGKFTTIAEAMDWARHLSRIFQRRMMVRFESREGDGFWVQAYVGPRA